MYRMNLVLLLVVLMFGCLQGLEPPTGGNPSNQQGPYNQQQPNNPLTGLWPPQTGGPDNNNNNNPGVWPPQTGGPDSNNNNNNPGGGVGGGTGPGEEIGNQPSPPDTNKPPQQAASQKPGGGGFGSGGNAQGSNNFLAVAFTHAGANTKYLSPGQQVKFFGAPVTDVGYGYSAQKSKFICYTPGLYFFTFHTLKNRNSSARVAIMVNGYEVVNAFSHYNGHKMLSQSAVVELKYGDQVYLQLQQGRLFETSRRYNSFSGFLITPL